MQHMPAIAAGLKKRFCLNEFETCARYMIFRKLGKPAVPADLYPNQRTRAEGILASATP
jgi:hypothetical protein